MGGQIAFDGPQPTGGGTHSIAPRQHWPLVHTSGAGHAAPVPQPAGFGTHLPFAHTLLAGQSFCVLQPLAVHKPPTHTEPAGQLAQPSSGMQPPFLHVEPFGQGAPLLQLVATHTPSTHSEPSGQSSSALQLPVTGWH